MAKSKCSGCKFWRYQKADRLYLTPGRHYCVNPNMMNCRVYGIGIKKIERDADGHITEECFADMRNLLPIDIYVGEQTPHRRIGSKEELDAYFYGALPYALSTHYRRAEP